MGAGRTQPTTPDLFSTASNRQDVLPPVNQPPLLSTTTTPEKDTPRHVLPNDLSNAIKRLTDQELDQLAASVLVEQQRRGKKPPSNENSQKQRVEEGAAPMSIGKLNAVRAAFKAGLKPSQIARQFRISQSDVRKALSGAMHQRELLSVINTSKDNPPLRPSMSCNEQGVELRPWSLSGRTFIALLAAVTLATIVGFLFWNYPNVASDPRSIADADLSKLFRENPDNALGDDDFLDLRDPACIRSFSLRLARRVFMQMSRNCEYSIQLESGRARVNFLNSTKAAVDLARGRTWSASDFWSIRPVTEEVDIRLEPTP
jgi:hypothetical protein